MKVFVTGGTGFIGSEVIRKLRAAGHEVLGLARSDSSARALREAGASAHAGSLTDLESLSSGAAACEAVAHLGFVHDFSRYEEMCQLDRRVIETLGTAPEGSDRPLVVTSGAALVTPGRPATEKDAPTGDSSQIPRVASEEAADALVERGVRAMVVRPSPSVHGEGDHGFVPMLIAHAREKGVSAFVGDGRNRWNAIHRSDAAAVYVGALADAVAGRRYHAVAEPEIPFERIATGIGALLGLPVKSLSPEQAEAHFGWLAMFVGIDCPTSNERTRRWLGWEPSGPTLLDDLTNGTYPRS